METRPLPGVVEFRASDRGIGKLTGYAAVFGKLSQNLGGFVEKVASGAFNKTLKDGAPVFARFNHENNLLLGTTESGTLTLSADRTGLRYVVELPDTSAGRDVKALAERGDLRYSSFAFQTVEDAWDLTPDGFPLRTLKVVRLIDVAPVTDPAYRDTTTGMRSLAGHLHLKFEDVREAAAVGDLRPLFRAEVLRASGEDAKATTAQLALLRRRLDLMAD